MPKYHHVHAHYIYESCPYRLILAERINSE